MECIKNVNLKRNFNGTYRPVSELLRTLWPGDNAGYGGTGVVTTAMCYCVSRLAFMANGVQSGWEFVCVFVIMLFKFDRVIIVINAYKSY